MKVAIVINELNIRGGTHKQVLRLCQFLVRNDIECSIYTKFKDLSKTFPEFGDFDIKFIKDNNNTPPESSGNFLRKIKNVLFHIDEQCSVLKLIDKDTDIINVHDNGLEWLIFFASFFSKSKIVWQINDLPICFRVGNGKDLPEKKSYRLWRKFYRFIAKRVALITVNVSKNKERVNKLLKVDAKVLYCGVDQNELLQLHSYNKNVKNNENFYLLSTGVMLPYRNYETLIEVIKILKSKGLKFNLDIIGSDKANYEYTNKIEKLINTYNLNDCINVWGQVDDATYNYLYNRATIFSFINIDQSWGLAVFEAMSCGLPTIVSNSVGAIELLNDGKDSIVVDPLDIECIANHIVKLINEPQYYDQLSHNAVLNCKQFTWDNLYCSPLLKIFKSLR